MKVHSYICLLFLILTGVLISGCKSERPTGKEAEKLLMAYNETYKGQYNERFDMRYEMYSAEFLKLFQNEVDEAIELDSLGIIKLPLPKQLRLIAMKNSIDKYILLSGDYKEILKYWDTRNRMNFPLPRTFDRSYTPDKSVEDEFLAEGKTWYFILMVNENGKLKIDPYNTEEFQLKRLNNILEDHKFEDLVKYVSFENESENKKINWNKLK